MFLGLKTKLQNERDVQARGSKLTKCFSREKKLKAVLKDKN